MASKKGSELADQLPSWNDGQAKARILEFVRSVTEPGAGFVPPGERIPAFDNDGTLWCEKPMYPQAAILGARPSRSRPTRRRRGAAVEGGSGR